METRPLTLPAGGHTFRLFLLSLSISAMTAAQDTASFIAIGGGSLDAVGVSSDGLVVAGNLNPGNTGYRWTSSGGIQMLGAFPGAPGYLVRGLSGDGATIVGSVGSGEQMAFKWAGGSFINLGTLPGGQPGINAANDASYNGTVIAGVGTNSSEGAEAWRWSGSIQGLGDIAGGNSTTAFGISPDGTVIVGSGRIYLSPLEPRIVAFRSVDGGNVQSLGTGGFSESSALAASDSGKVIVGNRQAAYLGPGTAARWTLAGGWESLQGVSGSSVATDVSADGSVIVGYIAGSGAFIWDEARGARNLKAVLETDFGRDLTGWTLTQASAISDDGTTIVGQGSGPGGSTQAWRAKLPLHLTSPELHEKVEVAIPDTIRWKGSQKNGWEIFLSSDNGANYTRLDTILPPEARELVWTPPDSLRSSETAIIRVADALDAAYYAESKSFRLRGWDLVRIENGGGYSPFSPFTDVWGYGNSDPAIWPGSYWAPRYDYQNGTDPYTGRPYPQSISSFRNSTAGEYPSWPSFVGAFGQGECYYGFPLSILMTYDGAAASFWETNSMNYNGSCYGLAASSLLLFYQQDIVRSRFPLLPHVVFLSGLAIDSTAREVISQYFISQKGDAQMQRRLNSRNTSPKDIFYQLRASFQSDDHGDKKILNMIYGGSSGGGHTVLPFQVRSDPANPSKVRVYVYDSNNPFSDQTFLEIDTVRNTWQEFHFLWPALRDGIYLDVEMSEMLKLPELPEAPPVAAAATEAGNADAGSTHFRVFNSPDAAITISGQSGDSIGYTGDSAFIAMPDAIPVIPLIGTPHPPDGYYLPAGSYSVSMGGYESADSKMGVLEPGAVYLFSRSDADPAQSDRFAIGDGFGYRSGDDSSKSIVLTGIARLDSSGVEFRMATTVGPQDSIHLRSNPDGSLSVYVSPGQALTSDLDVNRYAAGSLKIFSHTGVVFPAGASTRLLPIDDSLTAMLMFIDSSADGSTDDTITLSNQLTSIPHEREEGIPSGFRLFQNYPNPFNPSTDIRYALPEHAHVAIRIYDLLGREIATLVDGEQEPGYHAVRWEASGVPAGVYVYRLIAGDHTEARKMVILK